ncbi:hypothetical protein PUR71_05545 [Streptomyces sp. SP17BM10]|uniref:hypothetical protein n=1 Tax=Streptomyces sp. SP17BM10 TaxID=3002530 RepID=UPI002E7979BC|nr:hypothetical protein [Streptomyces sp. SP17BM10]MEE1782393.1 hypothetical protein [Streptomyces sp. SP17BM10]
MDVFDDLDDAALADQCAAMTPVQRRHAATLALWRLHAPLLMLAIDPDWGLHRTVLERVFRAMVPAPGEEEPYHAYPEAVAEMLSAPFFADPQEGEPDGGVATVQVHLLVELMEWKPWEELDAEKTERIIHLPREVSSWLDSGTQSMLWDHPARRAHEAFLAAWPDQGRGPELGYHSVRNLTVEGACHEIVLALPPSADLWDTAAGREALALCEAFSVELVSTLAWQHNLGH